MARVEMKQYEGALSDVELVLKGMPAPSQNPEAVELKERIQKEMKQAAVSPKAQSAAAETKPADGFRRMQIVEDDSEEEEVAVPMAKKEPSPKAQPKASLKAQSAAAETKPADGFRRMQIVEDDSEE